MTYETISLIADISLALSFVIALVFGIVQVRQSARDRKERLTLEALRNYQTREFAEISAQLTYHKLPHNLKDFENLSLEDQAKFIQFSQEMEALGILVADRVIDINLVDKTLGSFVMSSWQKYKDVFEEIRIRHSDPFLGEYFQWLAESINERIKKNLRKPYHVAHR